MLSSNSTIEAKLISKENYTDFEAVTKNDGETIKKRLQQKKSLDYGHNYIKVAALWNSTAVLKILLDSNLFEHEDLGEAIDSAAGNNCTEALKLLLAIEGATPNVIGSSNQTPLMCAAGHGQYEACKMLLEHKASNSPRHSIFNKTAFEFAQENGHKKVVELFKSICKL